MKTPAQHHKNRTRRDQNVRRVVTVFGIGVLITMLIMIWHLLSETFPLLLNPKLTQQQDMLIDQHQILSIGAPSHVEPALLFEHYNDKQCGITAMPLASPSHKQSIYSAPCTHWLDVVHQGSTRWIYDIAPSGELLAWDVKNQNVNNTVVEPLHLHVPQTLISQHKIERVSIDGNVGFIQLNSKSNDARKGFHLVWFTLQQTAISLVNTLALPEYDIILGLPATKSVFAYKESTLFIHDAVGNIVDQQSVAAAVSWLSTLPNNRSVLVGYANNTIERWVMHNDQGTIRYLPTYSIQLQDNEQPLAIHAHASTNAAFLLTNQARLVTFNRVTGERLNTLTLPAQPTDLHVFNDQITLVYPNIVTRYQFANEAGVITFKSLFTKQWYEGYNSPQHIYQTSSGTDYIEVKYALAPLFMGTLKAALSAMFVALPIALSAAIFTGYFSGHYWRNRIKSAIEMLEAVPSVVIAFIAAMVLVSIAEQLLITLILFAFCLPLLCVFFALTFSTFEPYMPRFLLNNGYVFSAITTVTILGMLCFYFAGSSIIPTMFVGLSKSTLIVSLALGLAISPTIYTLADDAIHSVPDSLKNASFALGATQLQTLIKVVLKTAMPGLVAAIMLGFGRAIGETMIVLMVTGNTPIPQWSLFASLRALTANIAIELTEAEVGSDLYTVLFFTASTLFIFTFVFNTLAEMLRYRMRKVVIND